MPPSSRQRDKASDSVIWSGVPAEEIVDGFLDEYTGGQGATESGRVHR